MKKIVVAAAGLALAVACGGATPPPKVEAAGDECPTVGTRECKSREDCGPSGLHCTAGRCYANQVGCPCTAAGDCGSHAHCTKGACYANEAGVPCSATTECGSRAHCSAGNCYANASGSPCSAPEDCGPASKCISGICN
jgi:hypothetical protein